MTLYPHQKKFLESDNDYAILCFETGTGKTFTADLWLEQKDRLRNAVVICPKQIRAEWKKAVPDGSVYSFEDFMKAEPPSNPSAIVVDEADMMASPLFVAKSRSKRTEKFYNYVMANPKTHILLLTATPVRSTPWNMHTLLVLAKLVSPETWKAYREKYFELRSMPYLPRPAWLPKKDWRKGMQHLINKYTHVALMSDIVDMPEETHDVITIPEPNYEENEEWEPMAQFVADHRREQVAKIPELENIIKGYRKTILVAHYTEQINELERIFSRKNTVFVLDGRTKDPSVVIAEAEADPECILIIQASVAAGFELPSFSVMVFVSMGYSVRNYIQLIGRIKRINALKPVRYIYLLGGRCDKMVYKNVMAGKDFVPSQYLKYGVTKESK